VHLHSEMLEGKCLCHYTCAISHMSLTIHVQHVHSEMHEGHYRSLLQNIVSFMGLFYSAFVHVRVHTLQATVRHSEMLEGKCQSIGLFCRISSLL